MFEKSGQQQKLDHSADGEGGKRYLTSSRRLEEIYPLTQSREVKTILKTPTPLARFKVRLVSVPSLS